ncbi:MAG: hypothetical protein LQ352_005930 [Teloschistes flavicans]|nr:MAG: hypothetical protein LQ352_005930 [Teloschistes flavicans]
MPRGLITNRVTYARNFHPQNLTVDTLTHVNYAFANVYPENGTVYLADPYADIQKVFPTDPPPPNSTDTTNGTTTETLYGCLNQLYLLKTRNRHLKTLLSIGGATYTKNFAAPLSTPQGRQAFVNTSVTLLGDLGFDGLELDWESPANDAQAQDFVRILRDLRGALDQFADYNGLDYHFQLAVAVTANPKPYFVGHFNAMDQYLDYWNLMAYDYAGSFNNHTGHASNLYPSHSNPSSTPFSTKRALDTYLGAGLSRSKIILGMPLYGRAFLHTTGMGKPYLGVGSGSPNQDPGIWDLHALPLATNSSQSTQEIYDNEVSASYSLTTYAPPTANSSTSNYSNLTTTTTTASSPNSSTTNSTGTTTIITYDTLRSSAQKAAFIIANGLGGAMFWESAGDAVGKGSLIAAVVGALTQHGGVGGLDQSDNWVRYPMSRYVNVRAG